MFPRSLGILVSLAVVSASLASAQQSEVRSVTVSVVPKPGTTTALHVKNLRDSPLVAWEIGLLASGDPPERMFTVTREDHFWVPVATGAHGAIQPGETRDVNVSVGARMPAAAAVTMAIFEDGYAEGTASNLQKALKAWQDRADDLAWWMRVFNEMPRSSDAEAKQYLAAKMVERAPLPDAIGIRANLGWIARADPPPKGIVGVVDREFRQGADAQLTMARRFLARPIPPEPGAVKSVHVDFTAAPGNQYDLRLENLADKVVEAWGFEVTGGKQARGERADACADAPTSTSGRGRIQPHEVRLEPLPATSTSDQPAPVARMLYVVFDDLSTEGPANEIDRVLREREQRAEEFAYWIAVLEDVLTMPAREAKTFLDAKEAERARQAAAANRFFFPEARDLLALLDRSPERFAPAVDAKIRAMEEARTRLLRHVKPKSHTA